MKVLIMFLVAGLALGIAGMAFAQASEQSSSFTNTYTLASAITVTAEPSNQSIEVVNSDLFGYWLDPASGPELSDSCTYSANVTCGTAYVVTDISVPAGGACDIGDIEIKGTNDFATVTTYTDMTALNTPQEFQIAGKGPDIAVNMNKRMTNVTTSDAPGDYVITGYLVITEK